MTPDPKDAALRERVMLRIAPYIDKRHNACDITDAVLAAIAEPAPTPEPPRVTLDHGAYAVWNGTCYIVTSPNRVEQIQSAITVAYIYVLTDDERDAKHAELMALKGQGEPRAPQKVIGACVILPSGGVITWGPLKEQHECEDQAVRYAAQANSTAYQLLLGAPLVRGDVTEGGR